MEVLRDEICRMICDHNGRTEFLFSRSSIPKHTPMLPSRRTLSLCVGLLQTPSTCSPGHVGRHTPHQQRCSWLSPDLERSLKPLTVRGFGAFGKHDRLTESQFINSSGWAVWEWPVPSFRPVNMYGEGAQFSSGSQWTLATRGIDLCDSVGRC